MSAGDALTLKVVLLGEGCVGKSSLLLRYTEDRFNERHLTTLQAIFLNKKLNINGKRVNMSIWDTAGQEKFHALGPIYYRNSNGALLVYDITDEDSFNKVKKWVKELKKMLGEDICLVIAGNKLDLQSDQTVPQEEAEKYVVSVIPAALSASGYAVSVGAQHLYTSAKDNVGVEEAFMTLTRLMMAKAERGSRTSSVAGRAPLLLTDDPPYRSTCCGGTRN